MRMWPFLPDFVNQLIQIDEDFSMCILETLAITFPTDCCVFGRFRVLSPGLTHCFDPSRDSGVHSVKKVPGIDHSKSPLKEIVKNLFDAKLAPLFSITTWSSSAICHLVYSQCSMLSVYLKCVSRIFQWIRISNKEFVSNFALQLEFRVRNC